MKRLKKIFALSVMTFLCLVGLSIDAKAEEATRVDGDIVISNGGSTAYITDGSYDTSVLLNTGDSVNVKTSTPIKGVYIIWGKPVNKWTLEYGQASKEYGQNGFLHEYIEFEQTINEFTIKADEGNTITDIKLFTEGELPSDIQVWEPSCEKADILLLSTHADDEILFFGGILPYYAGELDLEVQVVYFSQYWTGANIREHEKLDGLWHAGVKHYPVTGKFDDLYADNLDAAKNIFDEDEVIEFVVEMIRRFKPQVTVAQDENGEYGHGTHMLTSYAMKQAVEISMDPEKYPESAQTYGVWDVKKTYLHLYNQGQIVLDCRSPLERFGGKTTLEVASESYKLHVSQQWCWFYVDDEYEYSCAKYGLYRTTVGEDTTNDIMEHIVDYKTQYEEERKRLEEESIKESESIRESQSIAESQSISEAESIKAQEEQEAKNSSRKQVLLIIGIIVLIFLAAIIIYYIILINRAKKRKKRRSATKRRNAKNSKKI